jgi:hypothetical protein
MDFSLSKRQWILVCVFKKTSRMLLWARHILMKMLIIAKAKHVLKGQMCFKREVYHSQGIDGNNVGQVHSKRNIYQNPYPNIGDYDIIYGNMQMCVYHHVDWVNNMDDANPHQVMFSY